MGYSLSVTMKSTKARDKFVAFLREHFRPWSTILSESKYAQRWAETSFIYAHVFNNGGSIKDVCESLCRGDTSRHICVGPEEIAYYDGKGTTKIGFNYGVSGPEWGWQRVLLSWIALRGGRRRKLLTITNGHIIKPVPYICYDSDSWPILLEADIKHIEDQEERQKLHWMLTDKNGWREPRSPMQDQVDRGLVDPREQDQVWIDLYKDEKENHRLTGLIIKPEIERIEALWRKR